MTYFAPIAAVFVTLSVIAVLLSSKFGKTIQDIPNDRSLHSIPIPRIGGVGLMPAALVWWVVLPMLILFGVSLLDDMRGLPVRWRLLAHLVAAVLLVAGSGLFARHGVWVAMIVLLFTMWMTNLYNFMDGSDGLAGGMALFGFAGYGVAALIAQDDMLAMLNFPPARVFMGDAGSIPLGFLAATMGLWGWQQGYWTAWFPLLVFSPFIADASVTLVKRTLRGARITEAHREHYYQRAVQLGWGHRNVALAEYVLMASAALSALWVLQQENKLLFIALIWLAIYIVLMRWLDKRWADHAAGRA